MIIYHITNFQSWSAALIIGVYTPEAYPIDGFIHCSSSSQVLSVAQRFYSGQNNLVLLEINTDLVPADVVFENLEGGSELFPHIYGPINIESVIRVLSLKTDESGNFFPSEDLL